MQLGDRAVPAKCPLENSGGLWSGNRTLYKTLVNVQNVYTSGEYDMYRENITMAMPPVPLRQNTDGLSCTVHSFRGLEVADPLSFKRTLYLILALEDRGPENVGSIKFEFLPLNGNSSYSACLPNSGNASCTNHTEFKVSGQPNQYELFVDWDMKDVPGMAEVNSELDNEVQNVYNVRSDVSISNTAILFLPVIMSIPPIFVLRTVSDLTTLWYVFATDIVAVLPLLIKGVELVHVSVKPINIDHLKSYSLLGKNINFFEVYITSCTEYADFTRSTGVDLIALRIWIILPSILVDILI